MSEEIQDKLCEGYLITGEQKNVDGGFTVDFHKRNKFYFVLWKRGQHLYNLEGYTDESTFKGKRKSSLNIFGGRKKSLGSSHIPSFILTSGVKVHCMDMTIGRKKNHVIILVHAKIPHYFKTLKEQEIRPWYKALASVSHDMENRNADRRPSAGSEEVVLRKSPNTRHANHSSKDSGRGSNASSNRSSQDSCGSRYSDIISCPPSPSFIPTNIVIETDGTEDNEEIAGGDQITQLSSAQKARRQLTKSVIFRKRERTDSSGDLTGRYDFTEAAGNTYDSYIRRSIVIDVDDVDGDVPPPTLPPKERRRRGSEPTLQIPGNLRREQRQSPDLNRSTSSSKDQGIDSPPPLPARPPSHYYQNIGRKVSAPPNPTFLDIPPSSFEHVYERSPRVKEDISFLMWEQSKDTDGVSVEFTKAELLDSVVLITINDEVWVAGWKKDLNNQLYGKLHVGDKLRQINTQVVTSADLALKFIQTTVNDEINVTLSRLPNATMLNLSRSDPSIRWGIQIKSNIEIKSLTEGPAVSEGLTPKAKSVYGSGRPCDWVITEINHKRVPLVKSNKNQDFVKAELEADYKELPLVVQPHDFIKKLAEAVERKRSSQFY